MSGGRKPRLVPRPIVRLSDRQAGWMPRGAKRAIVGDALRRIGKLEVADPEIVEAVEEWRYRTKVSLAVKNVGRSDSRTVGLHPYDSSGTVFALVDCQIADFRLMALWRELRQHLERLPAQRTPPPLRLHPEGRRPGTGR